jgi:dCTP deaminase
MNQKSNYGVLSGEEILTFIDRKEDPLVIMPPLYELSELKKVNTVDLRLGLELIVMKKGELATLQFGNSEEIEDDIGRFYERVYMSLGENFVLHPQELVLGATLEYIVLPKDLMAYIIGRSSWGRLGLIIATATVIHPGYKGRPTLELVNHGNIPVHLYPGSPVGIAQLALHYVGPGQEPYTGKYSGWVGPTSPGFSKIHEDEHLMNWLGKRENLRSKFKKN